MTQWHMGELEFEWDNGKARTNLEKHGLTFKRAATVFRDPHAFSVLAKQGEDGERRWRTTGEIDDPEMTISVVYTLRNNGKTTRLISARPASNRERMQYDDNKMQDE